MEVELMVVSESFSVDIRTNTLSIFNVLEQLTSPNFPTVVPKFSIIALLRREAAEPNEADVYVKVHLNNVRLFETPIAYTFQNHLRGRCIGELPGLLLPGPGNLVVSIHDGQNGPVLGRWRIAVENIGQQQLQFNANPPAPAPAQEQH